MRPLGVIVMLAGLLLAAGVLVAAGYWRGWDLPAEPDIHTDYAAQLNAEALATPEENRAWLSYVHARLQVPSPHLDAAFACLQDSDKLACAQVSDWLDANPEFLAFVREGTAKPHIGWVYGKSSGTQLVAMLGTGEPLGVTLSDIESRPNRLRMSMNPLDEIAVCLFVLLADARNAASAADYPRVVDRMALCFEILWHLDQLNTAAPEHATLRLGRSLSFQILIDVVPELPRWPHDELTALSHTVNDIPRFEIVTSMRNEIIILRDITQRIYGADGRVSRTGFEYLRSYGDGLSIADARRLAPRDEVLDAIRQTAAYVEVDAQRTPGAWKPSAADGFVHTLITDYPIKHAMLGRYARSSFDDSLHRQLIDTQMYADTAKTCVALERFRRDQGSLPEALAELVPAYIDALPTDPADGEPIRYRRSADGYVLYALGVDGDDDGGVPPTEPDFGLRGAKHEDWLGRAAAERSLADEPEVYDGDWILYPRKIHDPELDG